MDFPTWILHIFVEIQKVIVRYYLELIDLVILLYSL